MSFALLLLLVIIGLLGIYSFIFLELNKNIVHLDLLFIEIDFQLGSVILISVCLGVLTAISLEILYFSSRKKNKSE
jgi:uncharacterized integral membrane protein